MKRLLVVFIMFMLVSTVGLGTMELTSMLGISGYAAKKIIDIIAAAGTIWSIVGIVTAVAGTGGVGVGILFTARALVKKFGKRYAAMW